MTIARAAVLATLLSCGGAPPAAPPLHNVAPAESALAPAGPRCPPSAPVAVTPPPRRGAIAGTVIDEQCEAVPGATIMVRSRTQIVRAEITDERGRFSASDLDPGQYGLSVYYLDSTLERGGVLVRAGAVEQVQLSMPPPVKGEPRITNEHRFAP